MRVLIFFQKSSILQALTRVNCNLSLNTARKILYQKIFTVETKDIGTLLFMNLKRILLGIIYLFNSLTKNEIL